MTRLAALGVLLALAAEARPAVTFSFDRPFDLALDQSATGPEGLTVSFPQEPPYLVVTQRGQQRTLVWAKAPAGEGPLMRARFGDFFLTVEAMADANHARLRVTREQPAPLGWGAPFDLRWCEFVADPDGGVWSVEFVDRDHVALNFERGDERRRVSAYLQQGRAERREGELFVTVEQAPGSSRGVRLSLRKPAAGQRAFALGKPFLLVPDEAASGEGLTVKLEGYGHKIALDGHDLAFVEVHLTAGSDQTSMRFFRGEPPQAQPWRGYSLRMTACEDDGPPHSATAKTTFVVEKTAR